MSTIDSFLAVFGHGASLEYIEPSIIPSTVTYTMVRYLSRYHDYMVSGPISSTSN